MEDFAKGFIEGFIDVITLKMPWWWYLGAIIIFIVYKVVKTKLRNVKTEIPNIQNNTRNNYNNGTSANFHTSNDVINGKIFDERISRIEKLGKLKDQGLLSEDEFVEEKKKLLK